MTTNTATFSTAQGTKTALKNKNKTKTKVALARHLTAQHARGTDGLTSAERLAYAQKAKSLHNSFPAEDLDKAFSRLP